MRSLALLLVDPVFLLAVLLLVLCGVAVRRIQGLRTRILVGIVCCGVIGLSTPLVSVALIRPLESAFPPLLDPGSLDLPGGVEAVSAIVVLGGGHSWSEDQVKTSLLSRSSIVRLVEGVRLLGSCPEAQLFLAGGRQGEPVAESRMMSQLAQAMGVPEGRIVLDEISERTADQARLVAPELGGRPAILVTSASHMRRAIRLFEREGVSPIPAPTAHLAPTELEWSLSLLVPRASSAWRSYRALYEYAGQLVM